MQQECPITGSYTTPSVFTTATPFEAVFADFFDHKGRHCLVIGDRLSGWVEILSSTPGTNLAGATCLVRHLRSFFATFGVPEELSSDGGPEFMAKHIEDFLQTWGVIHRVSSVSFPQSNDRAEVAVKTAKRLLMFNTSHAHADQNQIRYRPKMLLNCFIKGTVETQEFLPSLFSICCHRFWQPKSSIFKEYILAQKLF